MSGKDKKQDSPERQPTVEKEIIEESIPHPTPEPQPQPHPTPEPEILEESRTTSRASSEKSQPELVFPEVLLPGQRKYSEMYQQYMNAPGGMGTMQDQPMANWGMRVPAAMDGFGHAPSNQVQGGIAHGISGLVFFSNAIEGAIKSANNFTTRGKFRDILNEHAVQIQNVEGLEELMTTLPPEQRWLKNNIGVTPGCTMQGQYKEVFNFDKMQERIVAMENNHELTPEYFYIKKLHMVNTFREAAKRKGISGLMRSLTHGSVAIMRTVATTLAALGKTVPGVAVGLGVAELAATANTVIPQIQDSGRKGAAQKAHKNASPALKTIADIIEERASEIDTMINDVLNNGMPRPRVKWAADLGTNRAINKLLTEAFKEKTPEDIKRKIAQGTLEKSNDLGRQKLSPTRKQFNIEESKYYKERQYDIAASTAVDLIKEATVDTPKLTEAIIRVFDNKWSARKEAKESFTDSNGKTWTVGELIDLRRAVKPARDLIKQADVPRAASVFRRYVREYLNNDNYDKMTTALGIESNIEKDAQGAKSPMYKSRKQADDQLKDKIKGRLPER
jgi:hypothetical protein